MTVPKPKQVCNDPGAYWDFITVAADATFEGQHFDRKEAGRPEADGTVHNSKLKNIRDQVEECVSAFANATGGLLVLGVVLVQIFRLPIFARLDELKAGRWRGS
jgi:hypothetical protein